MKFKKMVNDVMCISNFVWLVIFFWMATAYFVLTLGFRDLIPFSSISEHEVTSKISAILGVLVPVALALTGWAFHDYKIGKKRKLAEEGIYDLLSQTRECLIKEYMEIVGFIRKALDSEKFLEQGYTNLVPPAFNCSLFDIIKTERFLETENVSFKKQIAKLLVAAEDLKVAYQELRAASDRFVKTVNKPVRLVIEELVFKEKPFVNGTLMPQPFEFEVAQDLVVAAREVRGQTFSTISLILDAIKKASRVGQDVDGPAKNVIKIIEEQDRFMNKLYGFDSKGPIDDALSSLAIEVNLALEKARMNKTRKLFLESGSEEKNRLQSVHVTGEKGVV
jgi:hypothetical protein